MSFILSAFSLLQVQVSMLCLSIVLYKNAMIMKDPS